MRRVPEVVEFYHSLMRRDSKRESGSGVPDAPAAANARNMIGEIENRSAYLLAVSPVTISLPSPLRHLLLSEIATVLPIVGSPSPNLL